MTSQIASSVSELIDVLAQLPPDATVFTLSPPFTGVQVTPQDNGKVGIFPLPRPDNWKDQAIGGSDAE